MEPLAKVCRDEGCQRKSFAQGYCSRHYRKLRLEGVLVRINRDNGGLCEVSGCGRPSHKKALCSGHYKRQWRTGSVTGGRATMRGDGERWLRAHSGFSGDECLIWPFARADGGYGKATVAGRETAPSRHMAILKYGPLARSIQVCHTCDNPGCVNPNHLFLGTALENHLDCVSKGRHVPPPWKAGEENGQSKITTAQAAWAKRVLSSRTMTGRAVAKVLGLSETQVSRIKHGYNWATVK